jgi:hypothetical protein
VSSRARANFFNSIPTNASSIMRNSTKSELHAPCPRVLVRARVCVCVLDGRVTYVTKTADDMIFSIATHMRHTATNASFIIFNSSATESKLHAPCPRVRVCARARVCSMFGALDGRVTYVIGKDGVVKEVYDNLLDAESHVSVSKKALGI